MSVESSEALERSVLESKDREQLLAIAGALGVKAGSRARKGDIIDRILETTGVSAPAVPNRASGATSTDAVSSAVTAAGEVAATSNGNGHHPPAPAVTLDRGPDPAGSSGSGASGIATEVVEEPPAEWELDLAPAADASAVHDTASGEVAAPAPAPERSPSQGNQGSRDQGGQDLGGQSQGSQDQGGQAPQTFVEGEGSGSSRRRRRRNRDRRGDGMQGTERFDAPQGQPGQGQPALGQPGQGQFRQGQSGQSVPVEDTFTQEPVEVAGYLDLRDEGYGFLRVNGYLPSRDDVYISVKQSHQYGLRKGDHVTGLCRPAGRNEKNPGLLRLDSVNGADPDLARNRPRFEDLTPLFPDSRLKLESATDPANMTARIIDLISPIGKGQRGLIVSPPKAGKTTIMKTIATAIERNNPEVKLIVLLIDERPEEVTDMRRTVKGEVIASTFDRPSDEHTHVAELAIERAKRMVEGGQDVVIILDGITRLSRAYNLSAPPTGRIMSGGIDAGALYPPKKFFGAARNIEEGGSLTILATALIETNSRMDDAIFEEFKGTGNMELRLDRKLAERRIYPAIDVDASSTRHEELLFARHQLQQVWKLRRVLGGLADSGSGAAGLELLMDRLKTFRTNDEFLGEIAKQPANL